MRSGTNLEKVRDYNEQVVLETIRQSDEGVSRAEIAERTGLTAQTVSNIARRLLERRLIAEDSNDAPGRAKRGSKLRINPRVGYAVGVQIDGDKTSFAIIDMLGRVTVRTQHPTQQELGPEGVIEQVAATVEWLVDDAGIGRENVLGLGVACPGPLDHARGIVYDPANLLGWHEVRLREAFERETGFAVTVDNDATAAAIGERWSGNAQKSDNFVFVYMGVGVGAGVFVDGRVQRGVTSSAGELGHMTLNPDGPECSCGNHGCVEVYCAPRSVIASVRKRLRRGDPGLLADTFGDRPENVTFEEVCKAASRGDALALEEIEHSARMLGCGVVSLVNLLDVDLIVLGGRGFRDVEQVYLKKINEAVRSRTIARDRRDIEVRLSATGQDAGAMGAASSVLHAAYTSRL